MFGGRTRSVIETVVRQIQPSMQLALAAKQKNLTADFESENLVL
jgi:hypothetical protein